MTMELVNMLRFKSKDLLGGDWVDGSMWATSLSPTSLIWEMRNDTKKSGRFLQAFRQNLAQSVFIKHLKAWNRNCPCRDGLLAPSCSYMTF